MPSEDLHPILKRINESLSGIRNEIQRVRGEVAKVAEVLEEGFSTLRDAIHENIQAQAEMELMKHMADVHKLGPQIEAETQQIETEKEELEARLEQINSRYETRHEELNKKAEQRIRDLGSHIFEIDEEEYGSAVESKFNRHVPTMWAELQEHTEEVCNERTQQLNKSFQDTTESIEAFINRRQELLDRIDDHRTDASVESDDAVQFHVPFYAVTVERNGTVNTEIVVPSQLSSSTDDWYGATLEPYPGFQNLLDSLSQRRVETEQAETLTGNQMATEVEPHIDSSAGYEFADIDFKTAFESTVDDGVNVDVESGVTL